MPIEPLTLSATVLYVGEWIDGNRDFSIPRLVAPGFTVVNVAADYRLNEYPKVFARIDNLFDERYEDPTGFLRPGFGVYGRCAPEQLNATSARRWLDAALCRFCDHDGRRGGAVAAAAGRGRGGGPGAADRLAQPVH